MDFPPNSPVALITTNGMFIIDDIYEKDGRVHKDVPGGGGMFAMLGACIVSTSPTISRGIKWIVDKGRDFPDSLTTIITSWAVVFTTETTFHGKPLGVGISMRMRITESSNT